ncbi:uncharacterized protein DS421_10g292350 [Arachis hypogaea]|nr:uncharacterized protein DS421_10g292350 [Arachis hypogaea]
MAAHKVSEIAIAAYRSKVKSAVEELSADKVAVEAGDNEAIRKWRICLALESITEGCDTFVPSCDLI